MGGHKVNYVLGGKALKPDTNLKSVSPGRFTKASRNKKVKLANLEFFPKKPGYYPV